MESILAVMKYVPRLKPFTTLRCITINSIRHTKYVSNENNSGSNKTNKADVTWVTAYCFPKIAIASLMNSLKLYQTAFTVLLVPTSIVLNSYGLTSMSSVKVSSGIAVITCSTLYLITSFFRRLIGFIYISDDKKLVKISHLTFWGGRNDIVVPVEDIVPLTDSEYKVTDIYVKIRRYSSDEILYLTILYGEIRDKDMFQFVFGDLSSFSSKK